MKIRHVLREISWTYGDSELLYLESYW
jgi:hypothetical protein